MNEIEAWKATGRRALRIARQRGWLERPAFSLAALHQPRTLVAGVLTGVVLASPHAGAPLRLHHAPSHVSVMHHHNHTMPDRDPFLADRQQRRIDQAHARALAAQQRVRAAERRARAALDRAHASMAESLGRLGLFRAAPPAVPQPPAPPAAPGAPDRAR